jgi:hypothetical protein
MAGLSAGRAEAALSANARRPARPAFQQGIRSGFHGSFLNSRALLIEDYDGARLVHQLGEINCNVTRDQISLSFGILFGLAIESDRIV